VIRAKHGCSVVSGSAGPPRRSPGPLGQTLTRTVAPERSYRYRLVALDGDDTVMIGQHILVEGQPHAEFRLAEVRSSSTIPLLRIAMICSSVAPARFGHGSSVPDPSCPFGREASWPLGHAGGMVLKNSALRGMVLQDYRGRGPIILKTSASRNGLCGHPLGADHRRCLVAGPDRTGGANK